MILIRNGFVHEHAGWFSDREALLFSELPVLQLEPLPPPAALEAARTFYGGPSATSQASWLATMSGGIPGLMSDLAQLAPAWAGTSPGPQLEAQARQRRQALDLQRPLRAALVRMLSRRALPPRPMLSAAAEAEIAALEIAGMVNPRYAQRDDPFRGLFWHLVSGAADPAPLPDNLVSAALDLEIIIRESGLGAQLAMAIGLGEAAEGDLASAFACSLFCQQANPELVRPLSSILGDNLGKAQIAGLLYRWTGTADASSSSQDLAARLLTRAGLT